MKIKTAIKKLEQLMASNPNGDVSIRKLKPRKKKRIPRRTLTATLKAWAEKKSANGGSFTFLEAVSYYDRIGGSAGTTTVWHRLKDIGARNVTSGLAETHLRARWSCEKHDTAGPIKDIIAQDPTFEERYLAARRALVEQGALAPPRFEEATFVKAHGKKGQIWVQVVEPEFGRRISIDVRPQPGYTPRTN